MKQSVDLMNSMKRFSFRHSNSGTYSTRRTYSTAPTSLARRVMLLLSVFLLSFGSAWGAHNPTPGEIEVSLTDQSQRTFFVDWNVIAGELGKSLDELKNHISFGWYVIDENNQDVNCDFFFNYSRYSSDGISYAGSISGKPYAYWNYTNEWDDNLI